MGSSYSTKHRQQSPNRINGTEMIVTYQRRPPDSAFVGLKAPNILLMLALQEVVVERCSENNRP